MTRHIIIYIVLLTLTLAAKAQDSTALMQRLDSVEISMITCEPGDKSYSLYGHTAIRINDKTTGEDLAVNYGVFDSHQKNFTINFIFGKTDYEIGICPFDIFCAEYEADGRYVKQQKLHLTAKEKQKIIENIAENARPENKIYRYNIFHNNCTTRARDVIFRSVDGSISIKDHPETYSFRTLIHQYTHDHPWAEFGNDILLGVMADLPILRREEVFLPVILMNTLKDTKRKSIDNSQTLLAEPIETIIPSYPKEKRNNHLPSPAVTFTLISAVIALLTFYELKKNKYLAAIDVITIVICGLIGILLTIMWFSKHPTVQINLLWLLFNPILLLFGFQAISKRKKRQNHWLWKVWTWAIVVVLICSLVQTYPKGIFILALSLLLRNLIWKKIVSK